MREYGKISTSLWMSKKFRSLKTDDRARLLYVYLHTCQQANSIGCFVLPKGYAKSDLHWPDSAMDRAIEALIHAGLVEWNHQEEVVRIVGFLGHSPCTNHKHAAGSFKLATMLPDCPQKIKVYSDLSADKYASKMVAASMTEDSPIHRAMHTTETETETDIRATSILEVAGVAENFDPPDAAVTAGFETWWEQFPRYRRGAKGPAQKIFVSLVRRRKATTADLIAGLGRYNDAGYSDSEYACGAETWLNKQRWTIERFAPPGDKHTPAPAAPATNLRYSNSSLARSLLQEIEHDHDHASPSRNGAGFHGAEDAGKRGAGPSLSPSYLRLAGPDETER